MNEWASKLLSVFPDRHKADFNKFVNEIRAENLEFMSLQKDFDGDLETRPSFEQLPEDKIIEEANKNIQVIKSLETILSERMHSYQNFLNNLAKSRASFESFQYCDGTLRQALDSLFVYVEQELQQARQQQTMSDVRRTLNEVRSDASKRLSDYQRELQNTEKEVVTVEKKLTKSKEQYDKYFEMKARLEMPTESLGRHSKELRVDRLREIEENITKYEREMKEESRNLLRVLNSRDHILSASRRAYQTLDMKCKKSVITSLKKLVVRERESNNARNAVLEKLELTIDNVDIDADLMDFIATHTTPDDGLVLQSQALSMLADLNIIDKKIDSSSPPIQQSQHMPPNSSDLKQLLNSSSPGRGKDGYLREVDGVNLTGREAIVVTHKDFEDESNNAISPPGHIRNSSTSILSMMQSALGTTSQSQSTPSPPFSSSFISVSTIRSVTPPSLPLPLVRLSLTDSEDSGEFSNAMCSTPPSRRSPTIDLESSILSMSCNSTTSFGRLLTHRETEVDQDIDNSMQPLPSPFSSPLPPSFPEKTQSSISESHLNFIFFGKEDVVSNMLSANIESSLMTINVHTTDKSNIKYSPEDILKFCQRNSVSVLKSKSSDSRDSSKSIDLEFSVVGVGAGGSIESSVAWLARLIETQDGRNIFVAELNKFRSTKVDVGRGFTALGVVLWTALLYCQAANDVHCAKIMMMLSQTFYRQRHVEKELAVAGEQRHSQDDEDSDAGDNRDTAMREYLKEYLVHNPLWQNGNFWEQALWQCAIEQLQTIQYDAAWYDMDQDQRLEVVRRIHDIIFSQVMAITHSMMELGCLSKMIREFVYRMCVIHQLSESQRQQLLLHLLNR